MISDNAWRYWRAKNKTKLSNIISNLLFIYDDDDCLFDLAWITMPSTTRSTIFEHSFRFVWIHLWIGYPRGESSPPSESLPDSSCYDSLWKYHNNNNIDIDRGTFRGVPPRGDIFGDCGGALAAILFSQPTEKPLQSRNRMMFGVFDYVKRRTKRPPSRLMTWQRVSASLCDVDVDQSLSRSIRAMQANFYCYFIYQVQMFFFYLWTLFRW